MQYTFIETSLFSRLLPGYWSEEAYREFQAFLAENPETGDVIQGTGGLRKVRWLSRGRGKRGGVRVIYYWWNAKQRIYLLTLYSKGEASDLTADQRRVLARMVEEWKNE